MNNERMGEETGLGTCMGETEAIINMVALTTTAERGFISSLARTSTIEMP